MNWMKTFLLMGVLTALAVGIGYAIGRESGMIIAFGLAAAMNFGAYWFGDKLVLRMYGAQELHESQAPQIFAIVRRLTQNAGMPMPSTYVGQAAPTRKLAQNAGMPMPRVYLIPDAQPNAFATGRDPNHAAVAVTEGITRLLNEDELEGVLAHELAHVKHRDMLVGTIAATIAGAVMMLSRFALFFGGSRDDEGGGGNAVAAIIAIVVAPIAALLIQMAISRSREYGADEGGARICGKPRALASALRKLERGAQAIPMDANPATAHMFIVNPFSAQGMMNLFSTHPPIPERVARLERMV